MKQRATLAYLLLHPNSVVPASQLLDALWPNEAMPTSARKILHNAVWSLRNLFPVGNSEPIALIRRPPGYVLEVDTNRIDLHRFYQLADQGRTAATAGDLDAAAVRLAESLSLWRGSALSDLTEHGIDWPELAAAEDARMSVSEDYFEIELARGNHAKVVDSLSALADSGQLRERSCGQLMLALYRGRRPSEALAVYTAWRNSLIENYGLEPGSELQQLQQAILLQSPSLTLPDAEPPHHEPITVVAPTDEITRSTVLSVQIEAGGTEDSIADNPTMGERYLPAIRATAESLGGIVVGVIGTTVMTAFPEPCEVSEVVAAAMQPHEWITTARTEFASRIKPRFRAAVVTGEAEGRVPRAYADLRNSSRYADLFDECERLLLEAPYGVVTVSERTRLETEHVIRYRRQPTGHWLAVGIDTADGPDAETDPDVRMLFGLRERVRQRAASHLVAVVAPAATSARRVARTFRNTLRGQGDSELILCARFGGGDQLETHRTMLAAACGFRVGDTPAWISAKLADAAGHPLRPPVAARKLAEALYPLATETGTDDPVQVRVMLTAWTELLCAKAGLWPTTLIFEDAHLADQVNLDFLETLLDSAEHAPLLVVLTGEGSLAHSRFARIAGTRESTLITSDIRPGRRPSHRRPTTAHLTATTDQHATAIAAS
ncbi:BTAD domain-containing putative transcriptional regulator [Nocardia sp. CA-129566]|uniref:BTAD domain-containing putative transcriptional regulator n=1 Tax=Nocardia sp. CA-129566 TaxID=3239976 RepID=UPI003D9722BA